MSSHRTFLFLFFFFELTLSVWAFFLEFQQNSRIATRIASARPQSSTTKTPPGMTRPEAHYFNASSGSSPSSFCLISSEKDAARASRRWQPPKYDGTCLSSIPVEFLRARSSGGLLCAASLFESKEKRKEKRTGQKKKVCSVAAAWRIVRAMSKQSVHPQIDRAHTFWSVSGRNFAMEYPRGGEGNDREQSVRGNVYTDKRRSVRIYCDVRVVREQWTRAREYLPPWCARDPNDGKCTYGELHDCVAFGITDRIERTFESLFVKSKLFTMESRELVYIQGVP